jgi:simple sugar transport system ATP-binding protein
MVGRKVSMGELPRAQEMNGESLLSLSSFSAASVGGHRLLRDVELSISSGEIVGIAGVEGSGQKEIWDYICGPKDYVANKKIVSGDFKIFGKSGLNYSRGDVRKQPVAIVPADRLKNAVMASQNLLENDLLGHDQDFFTAKSPFGRWIDRTAALRRLGPVLKDFDVRPPSPWSKIEGMSGGNQQKFVIGREFSRQPRLIFCAEPTRGVDVGSIERIHLEILKYRDQGAGVLLISSQLEELMALSDRILVMFEGAIIQIFGRGSFSESEIGRAIGGVRL